MRSELRQQLQAMLEKARRSLKAARKHWHEGDYDFACLRAYYAVFHVMQAALLTKGLTFSKHSGVISGFAQHFLRPGIFPREFGEAITKLRRDRETGDYGYLLQISREEAEQDLRHAEEIVERVAAYVEEFMAKLAGER